MNSVVNRPKIHLKLSLIDWVLESIGLLTVVGFWIWTCMEFKDLPEEIPIHFNWKGEADRFGSRGNVLLLPAISTILFLGISFLNRFPNLFNYPVQINEQNAERLYGIAVRFMRILKMTVVLIFVSIFYSVLKHKDQESESWMIFTLLGFLFLQIIIFVVRCNKVKALPSED